jgi:hypothetical protein
VEPSEFCLKAFGFGVLFVGQTVHLGGKCIGVSHVTGSFGRSGVQKGGWRVSQILSQTYCCFRLIVGIICVDIKIM